MKFKIGDIVDFIGTKQFARPNGRVFFSVKPGVVKIDAVMEKNVPHPYHVLAEPGSKSNIRGWVAENDLVEIPKKSPIKIVSLAKSKNVKICYAKNINDGIDIISTNWSDQKWVAVFRARDPQIAEKLAHMAEVAYAKQHFDFVQVFATTFIEICADAGNIPIGETVNKTSLIKSGLFTSFTSDFYIKESQYLRRGDILLSDNNSAIVLSNGENSSKQMATSNPEKLTKATGEPMTIKKVAANSQPIEVKTVNATDMPEEKDYDLSGIYKTIVPANIRTSANTKGNILAKLPKGIITRNYGYYTINNSVKWYYVQVKYKDTTYNGFVSEKCLAKQ